MFYVSLREDFWWRVGTTLILVGLLLIASTLGRAIHDLMETISFKDVLDVLASLATIATACVAVAAYGDYRLGIWQRRTRLVVKLKNVAEKRRGEPKAQRAVSVLSLMVELRMTDTQVLEAAFAEKYIYVDAPGGGADSLPATIFLRWDGEI